MKKLVYTFVASLALVACTPNNGVSSKVRISVSFEDEQQPNTGQQRISAMDRVLEGKRVIDVNWEDKDVLYWKKEGAIETQNPFKIISGVGTKNAFFENENFIGHKDVFTLYYHGASVPDFSNKAVKTQSMKIDENGNIIINNDYLMYTATNCKVGSSINLKPNFAILGVKINASEGIVNNFNNNDIKLAIGSKPAGSASEEVDWICQISEKKGNATSFIYYFVLPENSDYLFKTKLIWLTKDKDGLHPISNYVDFSKEIDLIVGGAQIITLNVQQGEGGAVAKEYKISK